MKYGNVEDCRIVRFLNRCRLRLIALYDTTEIDWWDCICQCAAMLAVQCFAHLGANAVRALIEDMDWWAVMQNYITYYISAHVWVQDLICFLILTAIVCLGSAFLLDKEYVQQYERTVVFDKYHNSLSFLRSGLLLMVPGELFRYVLCWFSYTHRFFGWSLRELCGHRAFLILQWFGNAMGYEYLNPSRHWVLFTLAFLCDSVLFLALQLAVYKLVWLYAEKKHKICRNCRAGKKESGENASG